MERIAFILKIIFLSGPFYLLRYIC